MVQEGQVWGKAEEVWEKPEEWERAEVWARVEAWARARVERRR
jgi:hypothetical protein